MYHLELQGSQTLSNIYIGAGVFGDVAKYVAQHFHPTRIHVVTDSNVQPLYLKALSRQFPLEITSTVIPAGEEHKNLDTVRGIYEDLSAAGLTRSDLLIALGGGVVGDIAGFAAATYLRGIHICQIPTTLLAQVDSSVGGKCGVDLPQGKNLVGAFYQPELVMIDTDILDTLPDRILHDGMAEVIKYGCIESRDILERITMPDFRSHMEEIVYRCVRIKRYIVQKDEHDTGLRMKLNFGHTIGHAVEKLGNYVDLSHGQAVAIGMVAAAKLNAALGGADFSGEITEICRKHDLPTALPYDSEAIYQALLTDKKRFGDTMNFVLVTELGQCEVRKIPLEQLHTLIAGL